MHAEYARHARDLDRRFHPEMIDGEGLGPISRRLRRYPTVRGVVYGSFGEGSDDAHTLVQMAATFAAEEHWRRAGARGRRKASR